MEERTMPLSNIRNKWLERVRSGSPAGMRLFCFPYAGAGAGIYRSWQPDLPDFVDVLPVQLPGRENRHNEPAATNLNLLAERIAEDLHPTFREKPFAIFGHSMGATLGFEVARSLSKRYGISPKALFVSGRPAPQVIRTGPPTYNLAEAEFLSKLRRMNGTAPEVIDSPELMEVLIPILRADFEAIQTYEYRSSLRLACPIVAFGGQDDYEVPLDALNAWRAHTISSFQVNMLPGNHFFLHSQQASLLELLANELVRCHETGSALRSRGSQHGPGVSHRAPNDVRTLTTTERCNNT